MSFLAFAQGFSKQVLQQKQLDAVSAEENRALYEEDVMREAQAYKGAQTKFDNRTKGVNRVKESLLNANISGVNENLIDEQLDGDFSQASLDAVFNNFSEASRRKGEAKFQKYFTEQEADFAAPEHAPVVARGQTRGGVGGILFGQGTGVSEDDQESIRQRAYATAATPGSTGNRGSGGRGAGNPASMGKVTIPPPPAPLDMTDVTKQGDDIAAFAESIGIMPPLPPGDDPNSLLNTPKIERQRNVTTTFLKSIIRTLDDAKRIEKYYSEGNNLNEIKNLMNVFSSAADIKDLDSPDGVDYQARVQDSLNTLFTTTAGKKSLEMLSAGKTKGSINAITQSLFDSYFVSLEGMSNRPVKKGAQGEKAKHFQAFTSAYGNHIGSMYRSGLDNNVAYDDNGGIVFNDVVMGEIRDLNKIILSYATAAGFSSTESLAILATGISSKMRLSDEEQKDFVRRVTVKDTRDDLERRAFEAEKSGDFAQAEAYREAISTLDNASGERTKKPEGNIGTAAGTVQKLNKIPNATPNMRTFSRLLSNIDRHVKELESRDKSGKLRFIQPEENYGVTTIPDYISAGLSNIPNAMTFAMEGLGLWDTPGVDLRQEARNAAFVWSQSTNQERQVLSESLDDTTRAYLDVGLLELVVDSEGNPIQRGTGFVKGAAWDKDNRLIETRSEMDKGYRLTAKGEIINIFDEVGQKATPESGSRDENLLIPAEGTVGKGTGPQRVLHPETRTQMLQDEISKSQQKATPANTGKPVESSDRTDPKDLNYKGFVAGLEDFVNKIGNLSGVSLNTSEYFNNNRSARDNISSLLKDLDVTKVERADLSKLTEEAMLDVFGPEEKTTPLQSPKDLDRFPPEFVKPMAELYTQTGNNINAFVEDVNTILSMMERSHTSTPPPQGPQQSPEVRTKQLQEGLADLNKRDQLYQTGEPIAETTKESRSTSELPKDIVKKASTLSDRSLGVVRGHTDVEEYIQGNEGYKSLIYDDAGEPAIGYGMRINQSVVKDAIAEIVGEDRAKQILAGNAPLRKKEGGEVFKIVFDIIQSDVPTVIPNISKMPEEVQTVVADLVYNAGLTVFKKSSPNFIKAINNEDWETAMKEMIFVDGAKGGKTNPGFDTVDRKKDNVAILASLIRKNK